MEDKKKNNESNPMNGEERWAAWTEGVRVEHHIVQCVVLGPSCLLAGEARKKKKEGRESQPPARSEEVGKGLVWGEAGRLGVLNDNSIERMIIRLQKKNEAGT